MKSLGIFGFSMLLLLGSSCTNASRNDADDKSNAAKQETSEDVARAQAEAKKLGSEVKNEAKKLSSDIQQAVNNTGTASGTQSASDKLKEASETAKQASASAAQTISKAALVGQVKAKLASDVGLNSVMNVKVDVAGTIATLSGTVASDDDRQRAEKAASQVDGITKVVNELQVATH